MESGRWRRIAELLEASAGGSAVGPDFAQVAAELLGVEHVSLTFVVAGRPMSTIGNSEVAVSLCERQFELGEGPAVAALAADVPVLEEDLTSAAARVRAPVLTAEAAALGAVAMFAFPLRVGGARVGVLTGHRSNAGTLDAERYSDGLVVSSLATIMLLQQDAGPALGRVDVDPSASSVLHETVQIAAGMVAEQLEVTIVEALVRMRARAFAEDLSIEELARRIVAREHRLRR